MSASAHQDLPADRQSGQIEFPVTHEQGLVIRKAAEFLGVSVHEYILCAVLDRAERDLYENAAMQDWSQVFPATSAEPITSIMQAFGDQKD